MKQNLVFALGSGSSNAPWYPKDFLQHSRRSRIISKSSVCLVLCLELFDVVENLFFRFSGQSPFFTMYVVIDLLAILQRAWIERYFYTFLYARFDRVALRPISSQRNSPSGRKFRQLKVAQP